MNTSNSRFGLYRMIQLFILAPASHAPDYMGYLRRKCMPTPRFSAFSSRVKQCDAAHFTLLIKHISSCSYVKVTTSNRKQATHNCRLYYCAGVTGSVRTAR